MIIHELLLDMTPTPDDKLKEVELNQEDAGYRLNITLFASLAELSIESGTTAAIHGTRPDGSSYSKSATINGSVVTVQGDPSLTEIAGTGVFEIVLSHSGKEMHSESFYVVIEPKTA